MYQEANTIGQAASTGVDRSDKAAPMPEIEKGDSLEGLNASGGGLSGAKLTLSLIHI